MSAPPAEAPVQPPAPLLTLTWRDLSALPLTPGDPTTAEQALADLLLEQWIAAYRGQVSDLQAQFPDSADPYDLEAHQALTDETLQVATARLDEYQARLTTFLATKPSEDDLVTWLAHRAVTDAGVWARGDALDMRKRANDAFYTTNPKARVGRWRVVPDTAAEARCAAIVGVIYPTFADADDALSSAWHKNCIHAVERAS